MALSFLIWSSSGCNRHDKEQASYQSIEGETMGTTYHITFSDLERSRASGIVDSVLKVVNASLSTYDSTSYISRFNRSVNGEVAIGPGDEELVGHFRQVWDVSRSIYDQTDGAFDPSASPLFQMWGFAEKQRGDIPNSSEIDSALVLAGFDSIRYNTYKKPFKAASVNFNAVAKGYGVDCVFLALQKAGASNVMVEIGGEVRAGGKNAAGSLWRLGVNKPKEESSSMEYITVVELKDEAMATSGNYRNYFEYQGKKYSHTIDPRTGYPVEGSLKSASIIAPDCATADAFATACMVMGFEASKKLIASIPEVRAILVVEKDGILELVEVE